MEKKLNFSLNQTAIYPLQLQLEVCSGVEPIDYARVVSQALVKGMTMIAHVNKEEDVHPSITDFVAGEVLSSSDYCTIIRSTFKVGPSK